MQNSPPDKGGDESGSRRSGGRRELLRYAGLSSEVAASIAIAVLLGIKADKWLKVSFPILSWCLPLLVIVVLIIKLIKDSSRKNDGK
ncbi:MAG TPA: hypothetical protein VL727_27670 [Puia sp.]|jgi:hypothetical protein|nr:hypothetical protein [Puia sp.]